MTGEREDGGRMFLVMARCGMDDLPLGRFESYIEAEQYVASVDRDVITGFARSVFRLDVSVFCNIAIVEFSGWMPVGLQIVRDLEDDRAFNIDLQDDGE
jgi:hypothetical protein